MESRCNSIFLFHILFSVSITACALLKWLQEDPHLENENAGQNYHLSNLTGTCQQATQMGKSYFDMNMDFPLELLRDYHKQRKRKVLFKYLTNALTHGL